MFFLIKKTKTHSLTYCEPLMESCIDLVPDLTATPVCMVWKGMACELTAQMTASFCDVKCEISKNSLECYLNVSERTL